MFFSFRDKRLIVKRAPPSTNIRCKILNEEKY